MELLTAIATRSSAARLSEPGPTPQHLAQILAAAAHVPDHGRLRPWRLIVLDGPIRKEFAHAAASAKRARNPAMNEEQVRNEREKIERSPAIIVVACGVRRDQSKIPEIEQVIAAAAAAQNLFLAAHALGYGVMWKTGAAAYDPGVKASLALAADDHIVGIMHVGTRLT
ncbi:MAG: nitroreductase family protein [Pseudomonadota bacterium]|nr:nitroreductase family protein [Pseudomonadota bacterium]